MPRSRMKTTRTGAIAAASVLLLASCRLGVTEPATAVHDTSAELHGRAYSSHAGTTRWWFEYGPTSSLGLTTPVQELQSRAETSLPVSAVVSGLDEATQYHYRTCANDEAGQGGCGATYTVTTTTGRDSVSGLGVVTEMPQIGYYLGAALEVSAAPDGSGATGSVSASPGTAYFRIPDEGPITCLRVVENQAVIGFIADATEYDPNLPLVPRLVFVEDNGPTGDRVSTTTLAEPATTCPDPATVAPTSGVVTRGDFVIHDHPVA